MTPAQSARLLALATRALALRAGPGNPYHDAEGKFTGPGGATAPGHGQHHARRQRRKRKLERLRKGYRKGWRELRAEHARQRAELLRDHAKARREHVKGEHGERKALARDHAREAKAMDRRHAAAIRKHEKAAPRKHAAVDADHATHAARIDRAERHARGTEARHERERAELEARPKVADEATHRIHEKVYEAERKRLRDRGATAEEHAALEQKIAEHRKTWQDPHAADRREMEGRHAREKAHAADVLAKAPKLRERLQARTDRRHARVDAAPARIAARRERAGRAMARRQRRERADQRREHRDARESLRQDHREERESLKDTQRDDRREYIESVRQDLADEGFRKKGAEADASRSIGAGPADALSRGRLDLRPEAAGGAAGLSRRLSPHRTHKASSAESILRHCLKQLGLTAAWRRDDLTDAERLALLDAVREYARAWFHHEAEQLFRWHGRDAARTLASGVRHAVGRFFGRARNFLKEAILAGAMALSGPGPLDEADLAEVDRQHAAQVGFLDAFERDTAGLRTPEALAEPSGAALTNPMTAAQFAKRASDYAGAVWVGAQGVTRRAVIRGGHAVAEARLHRLPNPEGHACAVCLGESQKGWSAVGSLLPVGDSTCLGIHCDCYFIYKLDDGSTFITARGWEKAA